jgi:GntR family transcriptional regulator
MKDKPVRQLSLAHQVLDILTERIDQGVYSLDSQLPPENALVEEFGVSRATVRRALDILEASGKIIRRHGIGSFVSSAVKIANPIDQPVLFQTLIRDSGYEPGVDCIKTTLTYPSPEMAHALKISEQDEIAQLHKVFTADGEPIIYLVNTIPAWVLADEVRREVMTNPQVSEPIFDFLEETCGQRLVFYVCAIRSETMAACPCEGAAFDLSETALVFDEVGYNQANAPVLHSVHYYPGNRMKFELIRRRVFS